MAGLLPGELTKLAVWAKGTPIPGYDSNVWRRDEYGNAMRYSDYGNRALDFGWERDHIVALALGGLDIIDNMRPLHWRANASLGGVLSNL